LKFDTVVGTFRRFLQGWGKARVAKLSGLESVIVEVSQIQRWFIHHRGVPMVRSDCGTCGNGRMYTIWTDGIYRCLSCLYRQSMPEDPGHLSVRTCTEKMKEFSASWLAYRQRVETLEEPWQPSRSAVIMLARVSRVRPPPICTVGACPACGGLRPFMLREDGDAGCIFCLMRGRIVEFEIVHDETAAA